MTSPIILASKSPRRKQLLEWAKIPFEIITQDTDENYPSTLPAYEVPVYIAREKAKAVQKKLNNNETTILAADTIVTINGVVIGKPANREEAIATLKLLSGQIHEVVTGVVILKEGREVVFSDITRVEFHRLTEAQISFYVDKYQPYDKAGAYAIQEWIGVIGIKSIQGDFYNVMGLPVSRVAQIL